MDTALETKLMIIIMLIEAEIEIVDHDKYKLLLIRKRDYLSDKLSDIASCENTTKINAELDTLYYKYSKHDACCDLIALWPHQG